MHQTITCSAVREVVKKIAKVFKDVNTLADECRSVKNIRVNFIDEGEINGLNIAREKKTVTVDLGRTYKVNVKVFPFSSLSSLVVGISDFRVRDVKVVEGGFVCLPVTEEMVMFSRIVLEVMADAVYIHLYRGIKDMPEYSIFICLMNCDPFEVVKTVFNITYNRDAIEEIMDIIESRINEAKPVIASFVELVRSVSYLDKLIN